MASVPPTTRVVIGALPHSDMKIRNNKHSGVVNIGCNIIGWPSCYNPPLGALDISLDGEVWPSPSNPYSVEDENCPIFLYPVSRSVVFILVFTYSASLFEVTQ